MEPMLGATSAGWWRTCSGPVHFILVEMRSLVLVWISVNSLTDSWFRAFRLNYLPSATGLVFKEKLDLCNHQSSQPCSVQDVADLIAGGGTSQWWTFHWWSLDPEFPLVSRYLLMYRIGTVSILIIASLIGLFYIILWHRALDFRQGNYLACTWRLQRIMHVRLGILFMAALIMIVGVVVPLLSLITTSGEQVSATKATLQSVALPCILAALGLFVLWTPHEPRFRWKEPGFEQIRFKRHWTKLFYQSNDALSDSLSGAICSIVQNATSLKDDDLEAYEEAGHPTICSKLCKCGFEGSLLPERQRMHVYQSVGQCSLLDLVYKSAATYFARDGHTWSERFQEVVAEADSDDSDLTGCSKTAAEGAKLVD